ncbi:SdiA-regulated domain-containing protein, partial [Candidatus Pacearchaeota archaeon]|nr:SdiA-regulated domain-containing protein [Candidatus Pacearchaeota archaeon]
MNKTAKIGLSFAFLLVVLLVVLLSYSAIAPQAQPEPQTGENVLRPQKCGRQSQQPSASQNVFDLACAGTYPSSSCSTTGDYLSCNDAINESALSQRTSGGGADNFYAGVNASYFNSTITDCNSITSVFVCYEFWQVVTTTGHVCTVGVDADEGASWTDTGVTCQTSEVGVTCLDVTANETWVCGNFFGSSGTRSLAKAQARRNGGAAGTHTWNFDVLFFNVTYTLPTAQQNLSANVSAQVPFNVQTQRVGGLNKITSESVNFVTQTQTMFVNVRIIAQLLDLNDAVTRFFAGFRGSAQVVDLNDAVIRVFYWSRAISDTFTINTAVSTIKRAVYLVNIFQTISIKDSVIRLAVLVRNIFQNVQLTPFLGTSTNISSGATSYITINSPTNNSNDAPPDAILNWTVQDTSNSHEIFVWASNTSTNLGIELGDYLVYHRKSQANGTYTYNFTAMPTVNGNDIVLLLHFDNLSSYGENATFVKDFSSYGNNATAQASIWNETGKFAGSYEYNGRIGQRNMSIAHSSVLNVKNFTISVWFIRRGSGTAGSFAGCFSNGAEPLVAKGGGGGDATGIDAAFIFAVNRTNPRIIGCFENNSGTDNVLAGTTSISNDIWYHAAYVYNYTNLILYLNGIQDAILNTNTVPANNTIRIGIGQLYEGATETIDSAFNGTIDEVVIWNRSLTASEVGNLYNLTVDRFYYWRVNATNSSGSTATSGIYGFNLTVAAGADITPPVVTIVSPLNQTYNSGSSILFNITLNEEGDTAFYSLNGGATNISMTKFTTTNFNATNTSIADGSYTVNFYVNDTSGNRNDTAKVTFSLAVLPYPNVSFVAPTEDNGEGVSVKFVQNNLSVQDGNLDNITYNWNGTNYSFYDDSLRLWFNFDNITALGENYTTCGYAKDISSINNSVIIGIDNESCKASRTPTWNATGRYGGAFEFYGGPDPSSPGQTIRVLHNNSLNPGSGDFAIVLWFNARRNPDNDLLRKGSTNSATTWYKLEMSPAQDDSNKLSLNFNTDGTDATVTTSDSYNYTGWHFAVAQRAGSTAELWVDGVRMGTAAVTGSISNTANLSVGSKDTADDDWFNGTLDEVRVYVGRNFTSAEINQLYMTYIAKYDTNRYFMYVNQTKNASALLDEANYTYYGCAKNNDGNENCTGTRNVIVDVTNPSPVSFGKGTEADGATVTRNWIFMDVEFYDLNFKNATFYLFDSTKTLVRQNFSTWYYAFDLGKYLRVINNSQLTDLTADSSDVAYQRINNTLFVVRNTIGSETIYELYKNGSLLRTITLSGFEDTEGITYVRTTNTGNHTFAIVEERRANMSLIFLNDTGTNYAVGNGIKYDLGLGNLGNTGLEGITYDSSRDLYYIVKEKNTKEVYQVNISQSPVNVTFLFNATQVFNGSLNPGSAVAANLSDLAGIFYDNNTDTLFILSQETQTIANVYLNGSIIANRSVALNSNSNMNNDAPEGLTFDIYGDTMYVVGEPRNFSTYKVQNFTARQNFTSLSNGLYFYNVTVYDVAHNKNSTETRNITLEGAGNLFSRNVSQTLS